MCGKCNAESNGVPDCFADYVTHFRAHDGTYASPHAACYRSSRFMCNGNVEHYGAPAVYLVPRRKVSGVIG